MFNEAKKLANSRMSSTSSNQQQSSQKANTNSGDKKQAASDKDVLVLDDNNFDKTVYADENGMYVVAFYAPWCKLIIILLFL